MNQKFQDISDAANAVSKLCVIQKDTVGWWKDFGEAVAHFNNTVRANPPLKQQHIKTASAAMQAKSAEFVPPVRPS